MLTLDFLVYQFFPEKREFRYSEYYNCNGIICLAGFGEDMMLCNPVLRENLLLKSTGYSFSRLGMAFGYDSGTDDYKIVRISNVPRYRAEVTTVGTNTWREIEMPMDDHSVQRLCGCAYQKEVFYRVTFSINGMILSFDMCEEMFYCIELPNKIRPAEWHWKCRLMVWNDSRFAV